MALELVGEPSLTPPPDASSSLPYDCGCAPDRRGHLVFRGKELCFEHALQAVADALVQGAMEIPDLVQARDVLAAARGHVEDRIRRRTLGGAR